MSTIKPFKAFRPAPGLAHEVASVPYDVVNTEEARQLAGGKPRSFLHVARPEIDLEPGIHLYDDRVYAKGVENLKRMVRDGVLTHEDRPCLYIYQQRMGSHVQAGLVGLCSVREYEDGRIKKHEFTRKDKEDDRTRHVADQAANAEPVFLAYRSRKGIDAIVDRVRAGAPLYDITADDGIGHTVWRIADAVDIASLEKLFGEIPALYVADGHHRTAAAARYGTAQRARCTALRGTEPFEFFMAVVFPHDQLQIMDYNRVVKDLNGLDQTAFLAKVREKFDVAPPASPKPAAVCNFGMFLGGAWHRLTARPGTFPAGDPVKGLDVSILQDNLLAPILGIADPRTDKRIDFVGGIRGTAELEKRVREGWAVAFAMFPASMDQLMAVADAGMVMPPKSTWFEPKLRSGLLVRLYSQE